MEARVKCSIRNETDKPIRLLAGTPVARLAVVWEDDNVLHHEVFVTSTDPSADSKPQQLKEEAPRDQNETLTPRTSGDNGELDTASMEALLEKYPEAYAETDAELGSCGIVKHKIDVLGASPVKARAYRANPMKAQIIETKVQELLDCGVMSPSTSPCGVMSPSTSPWRPPVILVPKKGQEPGSRTLGGWLLLINVRWVRRSAGAKYLNILDLRQGLEV